MKNIGRWLCLIGLVACSDTSKSPAEEQPAEHADNNQEAKTPDIKAAANDAMIRAPLDATPSPDGKHVYYTAFKRGDDGEDVPGVFGVAADGSGAITTLAEGAPLSAPVGIAVSLDGSRLFIADVAAGDSARGAVLTLSSTGGDVSPLAGTEGYAPKGLAIAKRDDQEQLYFTGHNPESTAAGVFRIAANGGSVETLASGAPLDDPSGVAISGQGDAYVVEAAVEAHAARVLRLRNGKLEGFVEEIAVGFPAGITLTRDDATLLVSGLDVNTKHDVVYYVKVASGAITRLTKTVGAFSEPAGLHRAHDADVFAWADSEANATGTVYVLKP
jgi:DNA-binding beta-propeller fold protein YncE